MFKTIRTLLSIFIILLVYTSVLSKVIHVPGDSATIQAGINGAVDGDTVLVADGVYIGSGNYDIFLYGKGILLASEHGAASTTIECGFDSLQYHRGFILDNGETTSTRIDGFTIHGAKSNYQNGGAIYCNNSSPIIQNCVIYDCYSYYGAALFSRGPRSPILENCTITQNRGNNNNVIIYYSGDGPIIRNCIISQNVPLYPIGGQNQTSQAILECCYMESSPEFCDSVSGDFHLLESSPCHPDSNTCGLIGALGVGCLNDSYPYAANIIISPSDSNQHINSTQPTMHWSYVDTVESYQTYFLIELGKGSVWIGSPVWQSDTIYLSDTTFAYDGPPLISHSTYIMRVKLGNDVGQGPWRYKQFFTHTSNIISVPEAQPYLRYAVDAAFDGDTIIMADGTYSGTENTGLNLDTKKISIISQNGPLNTIIDGEDRYYILMIAGGQDSSTIIDGLTIMNGFLGTGNGFNSAGITCAGTSPIIRNCIFTNNRTKACWSRPFVIRPTICLRSANASRSWAPLVRKAPGGRAPFRCGLHCGPTAGPACDTWWSGIWTWPDILPTWWTRRRTSNGWPKCP